MISNNFSGLVLLQIADPSDDEVVLLTVVASCPAYLGPTVEMDLLRCSLLLHIDIGGNFRT